ncbi:MAG: hypothetical protein M1816_000974 [Peltula sp. TS41687]|nr:MAG: hypothetical protein M1816_000974 [Peltula sp. TS41687]
MTSEWPRKARITPDDHGPILTIVALFFMVTVHLSFIVRLSIRWSTGHMFGKDDAFAFGGMLCCTASTAAVAIAVNHGLGKRRKNLDSPQLALVEKDTYISTLFFLSTLFFAKMSMLVFIRHLTRAKTQLAATIRVIAVVVLLWFVSAIFAAAFQCGLPRPWDSRAGRCFDSRIFWYITGAVDILTDVAMIFLPIWLVWALQMSRLKKVIVVIAFNFRILVIAAAICRLVYIGRLHGSTDLTFDSIPFHIATQCQAHLSILVASIPILRPFMSLAESGMLIDVTLGGPGTTGPRYNDSYNMKTFSSKHSGKDGSASWKPSLANYKAVVTGDSRRQGRQGGQGDGYSLESNSSDKIFIRQTTEWTVHEGQPDPELGSTSSDHCHI